MADYEIWVLGEVDVIVSGGGQLDGISQGSGVHLNGRTITLTSRDWAPVAVTDNDNSFGDSDSSQRLDGAQTINGVSYSSGTRVEAEYGITVSDGTTTYQMVGFNVNNSSPAYGTVEGLAFVGPPGGWPPRDVPLTVVSTQEGPNYTASDYVTPICFALGTHIATPDGERRVETLRAGDRVLTRDGSAAALRWVGQGVHRPAPGAGPVRFATGALGNRRDLIVSPQHRILVEDWRSELLFGAPGVLVPAKCFVNGRDVVQDPVDLVSYFHLLCTRHEVILSEGVPSETLYPGPVALAALSASARADLMASCPDLAAGAGYGPAAALGLKRHEAEVLLAA